MSISLFSMSVLLLSVLVTVRALGALLFGDGSSRKICRSMTRLLSALAPVLILATIVLLRYTEIAQWSKAILPAPLVALLRSALDIVFGTRSFSLVLQTLLITTTMPVMLLSLYAIVTDPTVVRHEYCVSTVADVEHLSYEAPSTNGHGTFLKLLQLRI